MKDENIKYKKKAASSSSLYGGFFYFLGKVGALEGEFCGAREC